MSNCSNLGGLVGSSKDTIVDQSYVKQSVEIIGLTDSFSSAGGVFGVYTVDSLNPTVSNIYSRASIYGHSNLGGLIGQFSVNDSSFLFTMKNSYSSNIIVNTTNNGGYGASIGSLPGVNCTFQSVYYNNEMNMYGAFGNGGGCVDGSIPLGLDCGELYKFILTIFDQKNVWKGDNLLMEIPQTYGNCNCSSGCPISSTNIPSTITPSTSSPSTTAPSTVIPSTITPSTSIPSTLSPSTNIPPTTILSTISLSSSIPSTNIPSTSFPSTNTPTKYPNNTYSNNFFSFNNYSFNSTSNYLFV
eukprot:TRINITY_DN721_c0_g1_i1.p1 TRINITY_DN721_c0_g1~~TRINITY_DN721_c0_g1_i1.p1  ORF type:complete len:300 (-),score=55.93 TRINITY_DN721_c0_g1_i1:316-1215(-)